ncbi:amidase [Poronia punctata]|nr:amidase [Poronia punctata]
MEVQNWQDIAKRKREIQQELISQHENTAQTSITDISSLDDLSAKLSSGELSSEDVVRAYISRACEAHKKILFNNALLRARELDQYLAQHGQLIGPLHGVPVTLKDQFDVMGFDSTIGYVARSFQPATRNAALVDMLESLGAIIIAKTNLPQSILWCETENPLWGLTTNPLDSEYTPGGSTGGESALLASHGSLLGWGTDIGGSVRIPAHMMGIYGFKPSSARLPYRNVPVSTEGQEHVPSSVGPMSRTLNTLHQAFKQITLLQPWDFDARCVSIPWREDIYQESLPSTTATEPERPLVIGVLADDEVVRPHPPITRVLNNAVEKLKSAGHEVVAWDAELHAECVEIMDLFYTVDGGEDIRTAVLAGGEPFVEHVQKLISRGQPVSVVEYWRLNRRKWDIQQRYLDKWNAKRNADGERGVDVLLMPPMPHTSVPHRSCRWVGYTKVWNLLDYPAIILPGGNASPEDLSTSWDHKPRNELDEWNKKLWEDNKEKMVELGLPVGVQIVGRRYDEEKVLGVAKVLDDLLKVKGSG